MQSLPQLPRSSDLAEVSDTREADIGLNFMPIPLQFDTQSDRGWTLSHREGYNGLAWLYLDTFSGRPDIAAKSG